MICLHLYDKCIRMFFRDIPWADQVRQPVRSPFCTPWSLSKILYFKFKRKQMPWNSTYPRFIKSKCNGMNKECPWARRAASVSVHSKDTREREIEQINGMSNNIALSYLGADCWARYLCAHFLFSGVRNAQSVRDIFADGLSTRPSFRTMCVLDDNVPPSASKVR